MWLRIFEAWLTARLLASPAFHNVVRNLHKKVREIQHGKDPSEMGGVNIDKPESINKKKYAEYFLEELRNQLPKGRSRK